LEIDLANLQRRQRLGFALGFYWVGREQLDNRGLNGWWQNVLITNWIREIEVGQCQQFDKLQTDADDNNLLHIILDISTQNVTPIDKSLARQ
jgi:hypothetical protein